MIASRLLGAKLVLLIYGIDAWSPTGRRISDRLVGCADLVISISQFTKQRFLSWSAVHDNQVHLLPNAIHMEEYGIGEKPHYLEQRYGLEGKKVLMTLARLQQNEQQKGLDEMLEVFPELLAEDKNLMYLIAGDGDDKQRLERKAASLGLNNHVVFAGRVPEAEKADHYRLADIFVMPGRQEGFGFVFLEAMASGIPVVASSLDGSREAVLDGELGELADPDDREALKAAIRRALRRPRQIPDGLAFFSYENFRERLQNIIARPEGRKCFRRMKTALICGVSGQDGAYLAKLLLEKGYRVFGTSRDAQVANFANLDRLSITDHVERESMVLTDFRSTLQTIHEGQTGRSV